MYLDHSRASPKRSFCCQDKRHDAFGPSRICSVSRSTRMMPCVAPSRWLVLVGHPLEPKSLVTNPTNTLPYPAASWPAPEPKSPPCLGTRVRNSRFLLHAYLTRPNRRDNAAVNNLLAIKLAQRRLPIQPPQRSYLTLPWQSSLCLNTTSTVPSGHSNGISMAEFGEALGYSLYTPLTFLKFPENVTSP